MLLAGPYNRPLLYFPFFMRFLRSWRMKYEQLIQRRLMQRHFPIFQRTLSFDFIIRFPWVYVKTIPPAIHVLERLCEGNSVAAIS